MNLATAQKYGAQIEAWLNPHCDRLLLTGSTRREKAEPEDLDFCVIPKGQIENDLLGHEVGRENKVWLFLKDYVARFDLKKLKSGHQMPRIISGGSAGTPAGTGPQHRMTVQLPAVKLDLWFATAKNWGSKVVQSTGSEQHNIRMAVRAHECNMHWFISHGLAGITGLVKAGINPKDNGAADRALKAGCIMNCLREEDFYKRLNLPLLAPKNREAAWLDQHYPARMP